MNGFHAGADPGGVVRARPSAELGLGIDIGSTNTKVALVDLRPRPVREIGTRTFRTPDDARLLLAKTHAAVLALVGRHGSPVVVGVASMAETGVVLDRDDDPVGDLVRWNRGDPATVFDLASLDDRVGASDLFELTGVPLMPKVPLVVWEGLRRSDDLRGSPLGGDGGRWAGMADLVTLSLTGSLVTDHTLAGRTMAYRLPRAGDPVPEGFDPELLDLVGIDSSRLPSVAQPGEVAGRVTRSAAAQTGLTEGTPVYVAGHDHAVGAWAAGVRDPADVADSLGTSEALIRVAGAPLPRAAVSPTGMSIVRTVHGDREALLAGSPAAGTLLSHWFSDVVAGDRDEILVQVARMLPAMSDLIVLPYLLGRQAPIPDPTQRLAVLDIDGRPTDVSTFSAARATLGLLEGMAFHARWLHGEQERLARGERHPILVVGARAAGGDAGLRVKASVMPVPLERVAVSEPVASGAALLAAVRLGIVESDATLPRMTVAASEEDRYGERFARFVRLASVPDQRGERYTGTPTMTTAAGNGQ